MLQSAAIHVIFAIILPLLQLIVALSKKYEVQETFKDLLCADAFVESTFLAPSISTCLAMCSMTTDCNAVVYIRLSEMCFILRPDFSNDDWNEERIGAQLFVNGVVEACPDSWTFRYKSCYKFTPDVQTRDNGAVKCRSYHEHAHLADFNNKDEYDAVKHWIQGNVNFLMVCYIGATYNNGWKWSDGTAMLYHNIDSSSGPNYSANICLALYAGGYVWIPRQCTLKHQSLCELDR